MTRTKAFLLMLIVTAGWGASYMWMKIALTGVHPLMVVGLRFMIAFIAMAIVFPKALMKTTKRDCGISFVLGLLLFLLFTSVVVGLKTTSASTAGFLTSTTAIFVAIFDAILHRRWPGRLTVVTTVTVIVGLYLLTASGPMVLNRGALFCLGTAALYAVYILLSNHWAKKRQVTLKVSILQLGVAGGLGMGTGFLFEPVTFPTTVKQWGAILALGLICSAFGFMVQPLAQRVLDPETISLIFSLEPLFAALFAFLVLGEVLTGREAVGAAIIFMSVVVAQVAKARAVSKMSPGGQK